MISATAAAPLVSLTLVLGGETLSSLGVDVKGDSE